MEFTVRSYKSFSGGINNVYLINSDHDFQSTVLHTHSCTIGNHAICLAHQAHLDQPFNAIAGMRLSRLLGIAEFMGLSLINCHQVSAVNANSVIPPCGSRLTNTENLALV